MVAKRVLLGTLITWFFFTAESIIHYSIGVGKLQLPRWNELLWILLTVFIFSVLASLVTNAIITLFFPAAKKGKIIKKLKKRIKNKN